MNPETPEPLVVIADSPTDAFQRIREKLGPDAVVLSVRALPRAGLAKLWQRPRVEVRARARHAPAPGNNTLTQLLETIRRLNQQLPGENLGACGPALETLDQATSNGPAPGAEAGASRRSFPRDHEDLIALGLLPEQARSLVRAGGDACELLRQSWRQPPRTSTKLHVFVGAPGVGKTTVLCKWLAQVVLLGGETARIWRIDGCSANTAESLSVFAEILSAPLERAWSEPRTDMDIGLIDLPGLDWRDRGAIKEFTHLLRRFGNVEVHLVLNAAYETTLLLEQAQALGPLGPNDIIVTHLDEEPRWGKLWNLVLGTPYPLRFLSVGPNVPGTFQAAAPGHLL